MSEESNIMQNSAMDRSLEDLEKYIYTAYEIIESDLKVSLVNKFIQARDKLVISQKN